MPHAASSHACQDPRPPSRYAAFSTMHLWGKLLIRCNVLYPLPLLRSSSSTSFLSLYFVRFSPSSSLLVPLHRPTFFSLTWLSSLSLLRSFPLPYLLSLLSYIIRSFSFCPPFLPYTPSSPLYSPISLPPPPLLGQPPPPSLLGNMFTSL